MTHRKAPIEVLEALAEDQVAIYKDLPDGHEFLPANVAAYRAATAPLRTRAERDAEITKLVLGWSDAGCGLMMGEERLMMLRRLCSEPTRDETEPNATTDHDADLREPEACSCEESEALRWIVRDARHELEVCAPSGELTLRVWRILGGEGDVEWPPVSAHELRFRLDTIHRIASVTRAVTSMEQLRISKLSQP